MRAWLQEERRSISDEDIIYLLLGVMEGIEKKVDTALAACKRAAATQEFLTIEQAASMTAISSSHLRRAIKSGELPASNVSKAAHPIWRIARKDLTTWLETKKGGITVIPPKSEIKGLIDRYFG